VASHEDEGGGPHIMTIWKEQMAILIRPLALVKYAALQHKVQR